MDAPPPGAISPPAGGAPGGLMGLLMPHLTDLFVLNFIGYVALGVTFLITRGRPSVRVLLDGLLVLMSLATLYAWNALGRDHDTRSTTASGRSSGERVAPGNTILVVAALFLKLRMGYGVPVAHDIDDAQRLTDDFNPLPPESFDSSHTDFARLREECPVAHTNAWGGFWALTRFEDVTAALRDYQTFTTSVQNVVPGLAFTGRRPPLHLDPPEHTWYRRPLVPFFTTKKMQEIEPRVRRICYDLWRPIIEAGGGEICSGFTHQLPGHVFAEFFNLSTDLSMRIKEVSVQYDRAVQRKEDALQKQMSLELYKIAQDIIEQRRAEPMDPRDDPASALLAATDDQGNPLPDALLLGTVRQLIVVGMIAPSVFIGTVVVHLAQHQELQQQLRENLDLVPAATEEYLRLFTPYRGFARTAKRDVVIGNRLIKKDEPIALVFASANRDDAVFPNGDQFILHRPNIKDHVAFGGGPHQCAGAPLGRLMLQLSLEALLKLTRRIDVEGEVEMTGWPEWGTLTVNMRVVPA